MKRFNLLLGGGEGPTRRTLVHVEAGRGTTRRKALFEKAKVLPTRFKNRKGRDFYLTHSGTYVVLKYGQRVYGRKAWFVDGKKISNLSSVPVRIRPKRL